MTSEKDTESKIDLDSKIGHWIDGLPYVWASQGTLETSYRYYFTNVDDIVYVLDADGIAQPFKMFKIEFRTREKKFSPDREIFRVPLNTSSNRVFNLFRVYNPYCELVPRERIPQLPIRINGEPIDPVANFIPEVRRNYEHHLYHEPLYLRYQKSVPPVKSILKSDGRKIELE